MGTWTEFEEIEAWQKARGLTKDIYDKSKVGAFAKDFPLRNQIRGAAISTMSNIAEGFERGGTAEFVQFLTIAKGSAGEVRSQLYVALDQGYITQKEFEALKSAVVTTGRMIGGLIGYLKRSGIKGNRYK